MKECACEGVGHAPWCRIYLVTERDRLMRELREANDWRDKLADKIIEVERDRDSLRQQVRELTEERDKARRDVAANRALSMLAPKEMSYDDRSEFDRLKHSDVAQGKRIADLIAERDRLRSDLSAALVSVDAMAERLRTLQPIVSVLGDWDWAAIGADVDEVGTAHLIDDRALMAVIKALARTAGEQGKESK